MYDGLIFGRLIFAYDGLIFGRLIFGRLIFAYDGLIFGRLIFAYGYDQGVLVFMVIRHLWSDGRVIESFGFVLDCAPVAQVIKRKTWA